MVWEHYRDPELCCPNIFMFSILTAHCTTNLCFYSFSFGWLPSQLLPLLFKEWQIFCCLLLLFAQLDTEGLWELGTKEGLGKSGDLYESLLFRNLVVKNMFRVPRDDSAVFQKIQGRFLEPSKIFQPSVTLAPGDLTPSPGFWGHQKSTQGACAYMSANTSTHKIKILKTNKNVFKVLYKNCACARVCVYIWVSTHECTCGIQGLILNVFLYHFLP